MKKSTTIPLLTALMALIAYGVTSFGQEPTVQYRWSPPTTGSPVVEYRGRLLMVQANGDTINVPFEHIDATVDDDGYVRHSLSYQYGMRIQFSVAGVDSVGRQGPWSVPSAWWVDDGPPGQPGPVLQTLVLE